MRLSRADWKELAEALRREYDDDRWANEILGATQKEGADEQEKVDLSLVPDDHDFLIALAIDCLSWEFASDWKDQPWPP